jgi:hypothetical protein
MTDTNYDEGLTMEEYQQIQQIRNWGISHNREAREINNRSLDLGVEWL